MGVVRVEGAAATDELRRKLGRMFQLGIDTVEFVELFRNSPAHAWVPSSGFGRLLCGATLFEDIVKIIDDDEHDLAADGADGRAAGREVRTPNEVGLARLSRAGGTSSRFSADELQERLPARISRQIVHSLAAASSAARSIWMRICRSVAVDRGAVRSYRGCRESDRTARRICWPWTGVTISSPSTAEFRRFVRERYHGGRAVSDRTMLRRYSEVGPVEVSRVLVGAVGVGGRPLAAAGRGAKSER